MAPIRKCAANWQLPVMNALRSQNRAVVTPDGSRFSGSDTRNLPIYAEMEHEQAAGLGNRRGSVRNRDCVQTRAGRQAKIIRVEASRNHGRMGSIVITEHLASDAYGLLILAPEIALGSGWLGGDRVVGRAAIRDLLIKAARFNEAERQRLTIYLPSKAITLRLDEIEQRFGA